MKILGCLKSTRFIYLATRPAETLSKSERIRAAASGLQPGPADSKEIDLSYLF